MHRGETECAQERRQAAAVVLPCLAVVKASCVQMRCSQAGRCTLSTSIADRALQCQRDAAHPGLLHAAVLAWGLGVVAEAGLHDKSEGEQERGDEEAL